MYLLLLALGFFWQENVGSHGANLLYLACNRHFVDLFGVLVGQQATFVRPGVAR